MNRLTVTVYEISEALAIPKRNVKNSYFRFLRVQTPNNNGNVDFSLVSIGVSNLVAVYFGVLLRVNRSVRSPARGNISRIHFRPITTTEKIPIFRQFTREITRFVWTFYTRKKAKIFFRDFHRKNDFFFYAMLFFRRISESLRISPRIYRLHIIKRIGEYIISARLV